MRKLARRVISLRYHSGIYNRIYISFKLDFKNEYTKNNIFNIFSAKKKSTRLHSSKENNSVLKLKSQPGEKSHICHPGIPEAEVGRLL